MRGAWSPSERLPLLAGGGHAEYGVRATRKKATTARVIPFSAGQSDEERIGSLLRALQTAVHVLEEQLVELDRRLSRRRVRRGRR